MTEKSVKDESRKDDYNFGEKQRKLKDVINLKNIKFIYSHKYFLEGWFLTYITTNNSELK